MQLNSSIIILIILKTFDFKLFAGAATQLSVSLGADNAKFCEIFMAELTCEVSHYVPGVYLLSFDESLAYDVLTGETDGLIVAIASIYSSSIRWAFISVFPGELTYARFISKSAEISILSLSMLYFRTLFEKSS